ncbi:MAG: hypothetical protein ACI9IN_001369, partial [Porticoccaceae bacterium]
LLAIDQCLLIAWLITLIVTTDQVLTAIKGHIRH